MNDADTGAGGERVRLTGELNAATVPDLLDQVDGWLARPPVAIDLAGVTRADSAGVALLLEIQRRARAAAIEVRFEQAPEQMISIISLCALDQVLPLGSGSRS